MKFTICIKGKWEPEDSYASGLKKRTEDRDRMGQMKGTEMAGTRVCGAV